VADLGGSLGWEVLVIPADGGSATDVTQRAGNEFGPTWSPDGSKIALTVDNGDIAVIGGDLEPAWSPRP
jgi:Tol biopolymer transport system component